MVDGRIRETYSRDSKASSKSKLSGEAYVKFFRWAADRLNGRDGIMCFVSNNNFVDDFAFDGMRAHLERDFERIDHLDLHGDRRQNPKISGTSHNVFGIQLGVGITLAVKKKGANKQVRYHRVAEMWRRGEKLDYLVSGKVPWRTLIPDAKHTWLVPVHGDEYAELLAIKGIFAVQSLGLNTNRDEVVFDFDRTRLVDRVQRFILDYNVEVDRHRRDATATFAEHIKWSSRLKECLQRGNTRCSTKPKSDPPFIARLPRNWFMSIVSSIRELADGRRYQVLL